MNKIINIARKKNAIHEITVFKYKKYSLTDIRFENVHLKDINKLVLFDLFDKNDLYINSVTLWELMQPIGNVGSHNYHELTPEDIYDALNSINEPYCVFKVKNDRYAVVPVNITSFNEPIMIVIEKGAGLIVNSKANINKIVTMYPKSDLDFFLSKMKQEDILFKK